MTAPLEDLLARARRAADARIQLAALPVAQILGSHLEGPFLSPRWPGVHNLELIVDPDPASVGRLLEGAGALTMVTVAPERPAAIESVRRFVAAGTRVSLGHTDAGATCFTHVFFAQRPLGPESLACPVRRSPTHASPSGSSPTCITSLRRPAQS